MRTVFAIVFSLFAACTPARNPAPARAGALDGEGPVLLVTHPTPRVMRRMQTLLDQGLLAVPNLRVVGVAHAAEMRDYSASESYVDRQPSLGFHRIDCPIDAKTLFQQNGCTAAFEALMARSVGIVFFGGPDIPPVWYGEPTLLTTVIETPNRIGWEVSLLFHLVGRGEDDGVVPLLARRPGYPVLAICLGMQERNVAAGGTLIQDIPSEIYGKRTYEEILAQPPEEVHRSAHIKLHPVPGVAWASWHSIAFADGSALSALVGGGTPPVLSSHHQSVEKLGVGLRVIATSLDGKVIEALEHREFANVLGVQFHPDFLAMWDPAEPFAEQLGDAITNIAFERMSEDAVARAFNRGIWELFGKRAAAD